MENEVEEWRDVPGYGGRYRASSLGRVRSCTQRPRILKPYSSGGCKKRYLFITLVDAEGVKRNLGLHVVVAITFHGPRPSPKYDASHRDNDPRNNAPSNIRWLTHQENIREQKIHGTVSRNGRAGRPQVLDENKVREIRSSTEKQVALAKRFGVATCTISHVIARRTWPNVQ